MDLYIPASTDCTDRALALIDRARAAGLTLRFERVGLTVKPRNALRPCRLDPDLRRELSAAHDAIRAALRAEQSAKDAVRRARRLPGRPDRCVPVDAGIEASPAPRSSNLARSDAVRSGG
jgi:hypothetical protein